MVLLVTPKFEFLTEKQRLKVKNDHFLNVFTGGRARTICAIAVAADALCRRYDW